MPVRLSSSSILKWPDPQVVVRALQDWVHRVVPEQPQVLRIGYFGSYARSDWGVGSDLDVVIIVRSSAQRFERRAIEFDLTRLPVPVDLLVYTEKEWQRLWQQGKWRQAMGEVVWIYQRE